MEVNWLKGEGNFGTEMLCPGRHITSNEWQEEFNEPFPAPHYDYISDYECVFSYPFDTDNDARWQRLEQAKQLGTNISIVDLVHCTSPVFADAILKSGGFKGGLKKINEEDGIDVQERFSWWSMYLEDDANLVRGHLQSVINPFLDADDYNRRANIRDQFGTSTAFRRNKQYGDSSFKYSINDLCSLYRDSIGEDLRFKLLGTYLYKQEIMHAVVICGKSAAQNTFQDNMYPHVLTPDLDVDNTAIVTRDDEGNWIWKPHATATEIVRLNRFSKKFPMFRRWDHVAFAFYLPSEDHVIHIDGEELALEDHHKTL